jgi:hypothetical protein
MSAILNTQSERRWVTETLSDRSGVVHDRVISYLHIIDTLGGVIDSLQKERTDALGALTNGPRTHEQLCAALEAMLAWPNSEDPSLGCEQATAQAKRALADAGTSPGPCYTEKEIRQAVKVVSGRDSCDETIDYLRSNRTAT